MIPFLSSITALKVVTNSVKHASLLIDHGIDTMILGGTIKIATNAVLGINAGEQLRKLRFNRCFMGMNGAHSEAGFTTPDPEEALIKQIALEHSQQAYVLLDHSKFQQTTFAQVAFIEGATIITDYCPKLFSEIQSKNNHYGGNTMIYTVTLNPSIDFIVHVDHLEIGTLNRMKQDFKLPGGKGINVSRILKRIGISSTTLGFVGGFTGRFIEEWLTKEEINSNFTQVAADTRINIKLKSGEETEINGLGPVIQEQEIAELKHQLAALSAEDIVILSGSKPAGLPADFYKELIKIVKEAGAEFVIDTTGAELFDALSDQPLLIKPNNHELAELYETSFSTIEDILPYGQRMLKDGAKNVIVSLGGDGALLFTGNEIYRSNVLKRPLKNSVGAGDSMIAGFIGRYAKTKDVVEAFKWGSLVAVPLRSQMI